MVRGLGRAVAMTIVLVALYFVVPHEWIDGVPVAVVLLIAPLVVLAVSVCQKRRPRIPAAGTAWRRFTLASRRGR